MPEPVILVPYDRSWPSRFAGAAGRLRSALGSSARRIDHIGSTSIPGLAAKPIIDIQISIASFETFEGARAALERLGYVHRPTNPDRTKRYFREPPGAPRMHLHVRESGSFSEQLALLFRDYLRGHPLDARRYEAVKRELAAEHRQDRRAYTDAKGPVTWEILRQASAWAQETGWRPGTSDA